MEPFSFVQVYEYAMKILRLYLIFATTRILDGNVTRATKVEVWLLAICLYPMDPKERHANSISASDTLFQICPPKLCF
jgi:hypothetical protein